jgi:exopolysaccharide production protein ExoY
MSLSVPRVLLCSSPDQQDVGVLATVIALDAEISHQSRRCYVEISTLRDNIVNNREIFNTVTTSQNGATMKGVIKPAFAGANSLENVPLNVCSGPALDVSGFGRKSTQKRVFDLLLTIPLLIFLAPLLLIIACAVRLDDSPVFYIHRRVGRGGNTFGCLKFRTMRMDADAVLEGLLQQNYELRTQWDSCRKLRHDPRVTRIGRLLRKTSLDELPQLFNVVLGEMSLVGPRPVAEDELEKHYGPTATPLYLSVRPGITGLWQVRGRSDISYPNRVALDCDYVRSMSLCNDVRLLVQTLGRVLHATGAY